MKKTLDGFKWLSISITVVLLVTVFWVWPAWNWGSQTWFWGHNEGPTNTMYRNVHPPSGSNAPFQFEGDFSASFAANEAATQMLDFGTQPWQYQIEWHLTSMMMMTVGADMMTMDPVNFTLTIGKWTGMSMMRYIEFFSAMGSGGLGSMTEPTIVTGMVSPIPGVGSLMFMPGDVLGAMVMLFSPAPLTISLANTCFITSPFSDPGYPSGLGGRPSVPTLSQWGMLVLAILLLVLYFFIVKRRIRVGRF